MASRQRQRRQARAELSALPVDRGAPVLASPVQTKFSFCMCVFLTPANGKEGVAERLRRQIKALVRKSAGSSPVTFILFLEQRASFLKKGCGAYMLEVFDSVVTVSGRYIRAIRSCNNT